MSRLWILGVGVIALLALGSCSKGGTTIDRDADETPPGGAGVNASDDGAQCGNGELEDGEDCDGVSVEVTCVNLGFEGGEVTCNLLTCMFDTTMCIHPPSGGGAGDGA